LRRGFSFDGEETMRTSMVTQDASTFVSLAQAVALARTEGVLDDDSAADLSAALVAGILSGCMEVETYGRVHEALALLLEKAFEGAAEFLPPAPTREGSAEDPLGVYLEVVGDAWEKVSWNEEACGRLKAFAREVFDLGRAHFGAPGWFSAPLGTDAEDLLRKARAAGLLVLSIDGSLPAGETGGVLKEWDPTEPAEGLRAVLGWGERRLALDLRGTGRA
jgi:hypothetical protein